MDELRQRSIGYRCLIEQPLNLLIAATHRITNNYMVRLQASQSIGIKTLKDLDARISEDGRHRRINACIGTINRMTLSFE
jgi:hypothetical protein